MFDTCFEFFKKSFAIPALSFQTSGFANPFIAEQTIIFNVKGKQTPKT